MIADAPYRVASLALDPAVGLAAGAAGAGAMLLVVYVLHPMSGVQVADVLAAMADVTSARGLGPDEGVRLGIGAGLHFTVASVLGLLYAACQQQVPTRGLVAVGLFYGFVVWIGGGYFVGWLVGGELRGLLRSSLWLVACFSYGLWLAGTAACAQRLRVPNAVAVPVD